MQATRYLPLLIASLLTLLAVGCSSPPRRTVTPPSTEELARQAIALEAQGGYLDAARLFQRLAAQAQPPQRERLLLRAAGNLVDARQFDTAVGLLEQVDTGAGGELQLAREILLAHAEIGLGQYDRGMARLKAPPSPGTSVEVLRRYHRARAEGYRIGGYALEAAGELVALDAITDAEDEREGVQGQILQLLAPLPETTLELLQPKPPGVLGGWMELARILKSGGRQAQLVQWRSRFPSHPALPAVLKRQFGIDLGPGQGPSRFLGQTEAPGQIAVLLPQSGRYGVAGQALLDGFVGTWLQQPAAQRPQVIFYDSGQVTDIRPLYQQAVQEGAELVVGPLTKELVAQLAESGPLPVPTLALNQLEPGQPGVSNLFQYGLNPEDEARQVADAAWQEGHDTAVILSPDEEWSTRVQLAFAERWQALGGIVAEQQRYNPAEHDFSVQIRALLNLDESDERRKELQRVLGKGLGFEPQPRQDADFIFLIAKSEPAREIRPQLQFHHAGDYLVYATSHLFPGEADPVRDRDLEGVKFPEIPWLLVAEGLDPLSRESFALALPESRSQFRRLYAMGIDAYQLVRNLTRLQYSAAETLDGKTGILYLDPLGRVARQMVWVQIEQGLPKILGYVPRVVPQAPAPAAMAVSSGMAPRPRPALRPGALEPHPPGVPTRGSPSIATPTGSGRYYRP